MKNKTTADEFKIGDKVYCAIFGEGNVIAIGTDNVYYPVCVEFFNHEARRTEYTYDGRLYTYANRTLFFSEPKVEGSIKRPFVSKLTGKNVVSISKSGNINLEYIYIETIDRVYVTPEGDYRCKNDLESIYEIMSDNILEK